MKQHYIALSLGFVAVLAASQMTLAQQTPRCADRQTVLERLGGTYGETRRSMGMAPNNTVVEMHASTKSGTWTITVTNPNGITCMVAAGTSFETIEEELPASLGDPA